MAPHPIAMDTRGRTSNNRNDTQGNALDAQFAQQFMEMMRNFTQAVPPPPLSPSSTEDRMTKIERNERENLKLAGRELKVKTDKVNAQQLLDLIVERDRIHVVLANQSAETTTNLTIKLNNLIRELDRVFDELWAYLEAE
ncbi:Uncharacterized protein Fot_42025 [Forsythia ovata]|uniref:Uncharacterized protein n=1 Tax=Forsythia ovata TaxID=205694 RepID=A0ABD1RK02_9LAMI